LPGQCDEIGRQLFFVSWLSPAPIAAEIRAEWSP
jgi:hypothetical protein